MNKAGESSKIFRIYARAIIYDRQQNILLLKKNGQQKIAPNQWVFPGGTCEWGEPIEDTLKREVLEEINLRIDKMEYLGTKTILLGETHWLGLYFKVSSTDISSLKNNEPNKHSDLQWWPMEQLPDSFVDRQLVYDFLRK